MKLFRVYYNDGNIKIFGAQSIYDVVQYVVNVVGDDATSMIKIEEAH